MFPLVVIDLVIGLLPGFAWLVFYMTEDAHPEPKRLIALTFFAGIAFGFFTIVIEQWFNGALTAVGVDVFSIASLLGLAFIEEIMKFAAAYFAVGKSPDLDQPVDRMIYMVVAALGFATLENIGAITNIPALSSQTATIASAIQTDSLRFVGATLLHSLTSAIVGYEWALGVAKKKVGEYLFGGLIIATILHALFNYLILSYGNMSYTIALLLIVGFFILNDFEKLKKQPT